ncbi:MAG: hypothetical protein KJ799_15135 [Bacteroidetes bacterium]|nr:hypothetical protein [Bacteroidota bacterium]
MKTAISFPDWVMLEIEHLARYSLLILLFCSTFLFSQKYPNKSVDSALNRGLHQIVNQEFHSAKRTFENLDRNFPKLPFGKIYLCAVEITKSEAFGTEPDKVYIDSLFRSADDLIKKNFSADKKNIWSNYFSALLKGYRAYYNALQGDYFAALSEGLASISLFEECLKIDSAFYEAYTALGTYLYWKSEKTEMFTWLPFIHDEREQGIAMLRKATEHNGYNNFTASYFLIWILENEGLYAEALKVAENMVHQFPNSRFFRYGYAHLLTKSESKKAAAEFQKLLRRAKSDNDRYNQVVAIQRLAELYFASGDYEKAKNLCDEALSIDGFSEYTKSKLSYRLNKLEEIRKSLAK